MTIDCQALESQVQQAVGSLFEVADPKPGQFFVLGASTSEVRGKDIGSAGDVQLGEAILRPVKRLTAAAGLHLAVQCCEHLNRCLVVEEETIHRHHLQRMTVVPAPKAGGAVAAFAMNSYSRPAVVREVRAHLGIDIGDTLIGMHLRPVVVPVRIKQRQVGGAHLTLARTRPPLVGGGRAQYPADPHAKKPRLRKADTQQ